MKKSIAIICGDEPAPGINTVISTLTKTFLKDVYEVLCIHYGYKRLFSENPPIKIFNYQSADRIFGCGGSTLTMSRFKPKDSDFKADFFQKNNVKLLITIGDDDTASRLTKYLTNQQLDVAHIHVPKTIDNNLPLPYRNPTFGFHTAKDKNGKVQPRLVDIESDMAQLFIKHLIYIKERDYKEAKQYIENPSAYDFKKKINWA